MPSSGTVILAVPVAAARPASTCRSSRSARATPSMWAPHKSSPVTEFEFYSSTGYDAVVANTGDVIVIDGRDYAENDGRCCPSLKVRYTLKRDEEGHWKLFNKKAL